MYLKLPGATRAAALGLASLMIAASLNVSASPQPGEGIVYIGYDALATITSGAYAGLSNPNANRLTLLFDHGNHFHGIGTYSYTGLTSSPEILPTNINNRIPEISSGEQPLSLITGSGLYAGTLRSSAGVEFTGNASRYGVVCTRERCAPVRVVPNTATSASPPFNPWQAMHPAVPRTYSFTVAATAGQAPSMAHSLVSGW